MRAKLPVKASLVALAAALLGACGGSGESEGGGGGAVTVAPGDTVTVVGTEYAFDPSTITVSGAGELEIEFENGGSLTHNLTVTIMDGDRELAATDSFAAGESETVAVELEAGDYQMVCTIANHEELGMVGEIVVE